MSVCAIAATIGYHNECMKKSRTDIKHQCQECVPTDGVFQTENSQWMAKARRYCMHVVLRTPHPDHSGPRARDECSRVLGCHKWVEAATLALNA